MLDIFFWVKNHRIAINQKFLSLPRSKNYYNEYSIRLIFQSPGSAISIAGLEYLF